MKNSRDIDDLKPYVAYLCRDLIKKCKDKGINIMITSTLRDQEYQTELYAQGRTKPGNIVTNAKLMGAHGFGVAFDIVPVVNDKCQWGNDELFNKIGQIGKAIGLEWAGDWRSFKEKCHFQYTQGLTTSELRSGKLPNFPKVPGHDNTIKDATPKPQIKDIAKGEVIAPVLNCYPTPAATGQPNGNIKKGSILTIYRIQGNWYLVNATANAQWVKKDYVKIIEK